MLATELIAEWIDELQRQVRRRIEHLDGAELAWRSDPGGNPRGVTVWHFSRWLDFMGVCAFAGRPQSEQVWFTNGWAARTAYDPRGLGEDGYGTLTGYTLDDVAKVPLLPVDDLLTYLGEVCAALRAQILALSPDELRAPAPGRAHPEPGGTPPADSERQQSRLEWLTQILTGSFRHAGEIETLNALRKRTLASA